VTGSFNSRTRCPRSDIRFMDFPLNISVREIAMDG
jgi:hypothetical protein